MASSANKTKMPIVLFTLLVLYLLLVAHLSSYMKSRPLLEKLPLVPNVQVMKFVSLDHREVSAAGLIMNVLMYYGGLMERSPNKLLLPADYPSMSRLIHASVKLDPYNMDAYYFAQATLVWDVGRIDVANELLKYGMNYRDWDWYLPFFAGFNYAYFLKDYSKAAEYYKRAGELSGDSLFITLAGRYMHDTGRTPLAIAYLASMEKSVCNEGVRRAISLRLQALKEAFRLEKAVEAYSRRVGSLPGSIQDLMISGDLNAMPIDPYGGQFYLDTGGKVMSTSKFAIPAKNKKVDTRGGDGRP